MRRCCVVHSSTRRTMMARPAASWCSPSHQKPRIPASTLRANSTYC
ncbi:hypothetical protein GZL_05022 [Streptomyces sp. 769]|nr:hypothetical protein GZL_05022 [Streptomyces sp. 769]